MEIIVREPLSGEEQTLLAHRLSGLHAQYVFQAVERLACPLDQKLKILEAVSETLQKEPAEAPPL